MAVGERTAFYGYMGLIYNPAAQAFKNEQCVDFYPEKGSSIDTAYTRS